MIRVIPFADLGRADHGWLEARYHFSFAGFHHPERVRFGPLRVWNDDLIRPGGGFAPHDHRDMEIITYVREGAVTHADGTGNHGRVEAGQVQVMSAGTGITHSEFNHGEADLRLFQIWLLPDRTGHAPRWETRSFERATRAGRLAPLVSGRPGVDGVLAIHQDATLSAADLPAAGTLEAVLEPGRRAYLVPARGDVRVNGVVAPERSGVRVEGETRLTITADRPAEIVLLDLP